MGRVAFVSPSLAAALKQYQVLRSVCSEGNHYEDVPKDHDADLDLLISIVLGVVDPHDHDIPDYDYEEFQAFWDLVEQVKLERFWQRMVRGPLIAIRLLNSTGLALVDFKENPTHVCSGQTDSKEHRLVFGIPHGCFTFKL